MTAALPDAVYRAVLTIRGRLGSDVDWLIGGSVAATLYDVDLSPNDVDVFTDVPGAYRAQRLLGGESVRGVRFRSSERVRSHFGQRELDDVTVDLMGGFQTRTPDGGWRAPVDVPAVRVEVPFVGGLLPVAPPELLAQIYRDLGRPERAAAVSAVSAPPWASRRPTDHKGG